MQEGAFALIDCLGFKGIWKRKKPELVIKKLLQIEKAVQNELESEKSLLNPSKLAAKVYPLMTKYLIVPHIKLLSDTVAISLTYENQKSKKLTVTERQILINQIFAAVGRILELFIDEKPHLVMRGCITFGEHICEGNFLAGPAVDEAAEYMNIPEGAFVWIHPNVTSIYEKDKEALQIFSKVFDAVSQQSEIAKKIKLFTKLASMTMDFPFTIRNYEMPIKGGTNLQCSILNPLMFTPSSKEHKKIIKNYAKFISGNHPDIWLKHQNTMKFLEKANEVSESYYEIFSPLMREMIDFKPETT